MAEAKHHVAIEGKPEALSTVETTVARLRTSDDQTQPQCGKPCQRLHRVDGIHTRATERGTRVIDPPRMPYSSKTIRSEHATAVVASSVTALEDDHIVATIRVPIRTVGDVLATRAS